MTEPARVVNAHGYYLMERGWMEHPALQGKEFDRRSAWVWLVENAAWRATKVDVLGQTVTVERGQLCRTQRNISAAWDWPLSKTQRFLDRLKNGSLIEVETDSGRTMITICNYDETQSPQRRSALMNNSVGGSGPGHAQVNTRSQKKETNKEKEVNEESDPPGLVQQSGPNSIEKRAAEPETRGKGRERQVQEAVRLWNELAARRGLRQIRILNPTRKARLLYKLSAVGGIEGWKAAMAEVETSRYLCGENDRGWTADFDFVLKEDILTRIEEGVYRARARETQGHVQQLARALTGKDHLR